MTGGADAVLAAALRYVETYNRCTDEFVDACASDDFIAVGFPDGEVLGEGRESLRASALEVLRAVPDRQIEIRAVTPIGDWVAGQVTYTGTVVEAHESFPPAGEHFAIELLLVWQIRDERVAVEHIYRG